jgi:uncharacterized protein YdaU (DUF1376 family)
MARRTRSRQIEIFNFSFLDILACTIGLLIFIMVMVFILQSGSPVADTNAVLRRKSDETQRQRTAAEQDAAIAAQLEDQLGRIHDSVKPDLRAGRDLAAQQTAAARADYENSLARLHTAEAELAAAQRARQQKTDSDLQAAQSRLTKARDDNNAAKAAVAEAANEPVVEQLRFLPEKPPGAEAADDHHVMHLDCRADAVVLFVTAPDGSVRESQGFPISDIGDTGSGLTRLLEAQMADQNPLVLLWVRPDGVDTFEKLKAALPAGLAFGYEPADAGWQFSKAPPR